MPNTWTGELCFTYVHGDVCEGRTSAHGTARVSLGDMVPVRPAGQRDKYHRLPHRVLEFYTLFCNAADQTQGCSWAKHPLCPPALAIQVPKQKDSQRPQMGGRGSGREGSVPSVAVVQEDRILGMYKVTSVMPSLLQLKTSAPFCVLTTFSSLGHRT